MGKPVVRPETARGLLLKASSVGCRRHHVIGGFETFHETLNNTMSSEKNKKGESSRFAGTVICALYRSDIQYVHLQRYIPKSPLSAW